MLFKSKVETKTKAKR